MTFQLEIMNNKSTLFHPE